MIINRYGLLAAYIGGPAAQVGRLGPKIGGHLAPFLYSLHEPSELSQWLGHNDSTINIVVVIIVILTDCKISDASSNAKIPLDTFPRKTGK